MDEEYFNTLIVESDKKYSNIVINKEELTTDKENITAQIVYNISGEEIDTITLILTPYETDKKKVEIKNTTWEVDKDFTINLNGYYELTDNTTYILQVQIETKTGKIITKTYKFSFNKYEKPTTKGKKTDKHNYIVEHNIEFDEE